MNSYKENAENEIFAYQYLEPQMWFQNNQQFLPELAAPLTAMYQQQQRVQPVAPDIGQQSLKQLNHEDSFQAKFCNFVSTDRKPSDMHLGGEKRATDAATITVTEDPKIPVAFPRKKHKRIKFTDYQLAALENYYKKQAYIMRKERIVLSEETGIPEESITMWFQNRRMKPKAKLKRQEKGLEKVGWMTKEVLSALNDNKTTSQTEKNVEWVSVPRVEEKTATTGESECYTWNKCSPIVEGQPELSSSYESTLHGYEQNEIAPAPEYYTRHELPQMRAGQVDMETVLPVRNFELTSVPFSAEQTATTGAPVCYTWNTFPPIVEGQPELSSQFESALHGYVQTGTAPAPENYTRHELPQMRAGQVDMETVLPVRNFELTSVPFSAEQTATIRAPECNTWNTFPPIVERQTELSLKFESASHGYVQTGTAPAAESYTRHEFPQLVAGQTHMYTVHPEQNFKWSSASCADEQTVTTPAWESYRCHDLSLEAEGQADLDIVMEYISTNNNPKKLDDLNEIVDRGSAVPDQEYFKVPSHFEGVSQNCYSII